MLPGITPALFGGGFLAPSQAFGNDSYTVALLHFDAPDGSVGVSGQGLRDSAYGAPARKNAWAPTTGTFQTTTGLCNQVAYFTGNVIQCPDAPDLDLGAGDFTVDFWLALNNITNSGLIAGGRMPVAGYAAWMVYQNASQVGFYGASAPGAWDIASNQNFGGPGLAVNIWYHYAVTRQGNTYRLFLNGALQTTFTSALRPMSNTGPTQIGQNWVGWMEEFRISKGICRWAAAFTPPNQPYYAQLNGGNDAATKLLLHFDKDTFALDSSNGSQVLKTVINNGAGQLGSPTSTALTLNVAQVNGGTSRITVASSTELNNIRANFTIDFFYYRVANAPNTIVFTRRNTNTQYCPIQLTDMGGGTLHLYMSTNGSTWSIDADCATGLALSTWYHLALVRNRNLLTFYVNGAQTFQQDVALTTFQTSTYDLQIGADTNASGNSALFDEFRYSDVARWTAPFTAPAPGDAPYGPNSARDANTKLLMHFDATDGYYSDSSPYHRGTATNGGGAGATGAQSKFGGVSMSFNGTATGYLSYPDSPDWFFGSNDFTIDFWIYPTAVPASSAGLFVQMAGNTDYNNRFAVRLNNANPPLVRVEYVLGGASQIANFTTLPLTMNAWNHVAVVRSGNTLSVYINGVFDASVAFSGSFQDMSGSIYIGAYSDGQSPFSGYLDEYRVSNVARWTSSFTPPTAPYTV